MSGALVVAGATIMCTFGTGPSNFTATQTPMVLGAGKPVGITLENAPMMNIAPFPLCTSPANPAVAAAMGAPSTCTPMLTAPWMPGAPKILVKGKVCLTQSDTLMCAYGGQITVVNPGQTKVVTS